MKEMLEIFTNKIFIGLVIFVMVVTYVGSRPEQKNDLNQPAIETSQNVNINK